MWMIPIAVGACVLPLAVACSPTDASMDGSAGESTCPLTVANRSIPADANNWAGNQSENSHGNGQLWTLFWPHNVVVATPEFVEDNGSVRMKWPWWRGVPGELVIEGRRLDRDVARLHAEIPRFYGPSGFQPSSIFFPTEGCWEVSGKVGDARLTFVTLVMKALRHAR